MSKSETENTPLNVRLDKWLWAARFFKTRAIARDMVQSGKVHYNGQRAKPSRRVELGAIINVPTGWVVREIRVLGLSDKRLGAALAQALFEETEESVKKREENQAARKLNAFHSPKPDHRPDKKQRRQIIKFKQQ